MRAVRATPRTAKDPALDKCAAILGPNRPGINQPDPSKKAARNSSATRDARVSEQALKQVPTEPRARMGARVRLLDYLLGHEAPSQSIVANPASSAR